LNWVLLKVDERSQSRPFLLRALANAEPHIQNRKLLLWGPPVTLALPFLRLFAPSYG
jgi:hypothetical protein